jgi:bifunctional non-homologous end joining protein LigD
MPDKPAPGLAQLLRYQQKRDFTQTAEPAGGLPLPSGDLSFVIQQHAATRLHWDFRLEVDGVLVSWAVPKGPSLDPKVKRVAAHVEDHPYDYGSFEGVIPKGNYGAGQVIVWDRGTYTPDEKGVLSWGDKAEGSRRMLEDMAAGKVSITLRGQKLHGSWTLVQIKADPKSWLLIKHRDEYASTRDILEEDRSVICGLTLQDLKEGRLPRMTSAGGPPHPTARGAPFPDAKTLRPMLATLVKAPFSKAGWIFEPKLDGVRTLAFVQDGNIELRTRRGNNQTVQYPEVVAGLQQASSGHTMVIDGEIVAIGEAGAPSFQDLQGRINLSRPAEVARAAAETPAYLYAFDILYLDGWDLRHVPLVERKAILRRTLTPGPHVRLVDHERDGVMLFDAAMRVGFEGVVGKRETSTYDAGARTPSWVKIKGVNEQEFVIGGFTEGEGSRSKTFGGVLVGYYTLDNEQQTADNRMPDELVFAGSVGSGFTDKTLADTYKRLKALQVDAPPFENPPTTIGGRWSGGKSAKCFWVKPELVARVKFHSWTKDGNLRAPVFLGLREDIDPATIGREQAVVASAVDVIEDEAPASGSEIEGAVASVLDQLASNTKPDFTLDVGGVPIKLTNLDKEFWPATDEHPARTKRDLIRYYARVAPHILPHLRDRPLTLTRYPNGIYGKSFYQKHWASPFPTEFRVERAQVYSSHNDANGEYILVNNLQTIIWLAQLADLELHASMARVDPEPDALGLPTVFAGSEEVLEASVLNYPDYMVFDLDPYIYAGTEKKGEEPALNRRAFEKAREMAFALKELLEQLRLSSFVKTTGKTGLHVYVPVLRQYTYDEIRAASAVVGQFMVQQYPDDLTMEWQTQKRTGRIFFDHNQNSRGKTLAAQYSVRPSAGANVSAPITWEELKSVYPTQFDIDTVPKRLASVGDLWAEILDAKQDLMALMGSS